MSTGSEIVFDALEKYPETPTLTLAKKIYKENKSVFPRLEAARCMIRYYRGQLGKSHRESLATRKYIKPQGSKSPFESLPDGLKYWEEWEPYEIESKRTLVLSDIHIPYHERQPLYMALGYGAKHNVDGILLNGDFLDFFSLSFWEKDPRKRNFQEELNIGRSILEIIRQGFPNAKIYYKTGNHEERYTRYLGVKAPELLGVDHFELAKILGLDKLDIQLISDKRIIKAGLLSVIHGHEFGRSISSPVNPARGLYLRGQDTAIAGHWHRSSEHHEKSMNGEIISCWSSGCLCNLNPDWLPINKWNHGFIIIDIKNDLGEFEVWNKKILDQSIY